MTALYHDNNASIDSINNTFNALAERLTTAIRLDGKRIGLKEKAQVEGNLLETKVCVKFVWQWLILPGALLVLSTVLLMSMVVKDTVAKKASLEDLYIATFTAGSCWYTKNKLEQSGRDIRRLGG